MIHGRRTTARRTLARRLVAWLCAGIVAVPLPTPAQQAPASAVFKAEELDQLVAPIALHPDPLLAQILMASTYPLEVVQAARFVKDNPNLKGEQLNEALKQSDWDDSVKSLVTFPQILAMMDTKIDWTQKLGDAFLAQQKELLDSVQRLRAKAQAEGSLQSSPELLVTSQPAAPAAPAQPPVVVQQAPPTVISIQPANPQVVQVPTYDPAVVYGAWPYPAYPPPPPYYPPGYVPGAALFSFAAGVAVGGALWGDCDWNGGEVNVNRQEYNNYTKNVNKENVAQNRSERQASRQTWQHNPENRRGTQYRDPATQQRFNRAGNPQATQARENFRGRAEQGRQDIGRAGGQPPGQGAAGRQPSAQPRGAGGSQVSGERGGGGGALQGMGQGRDVQQFSNRGQASRQSSVAATRSAGGGAAGGVRGAGGARGGGGGRAGGGRR
jgi:hypothetical protein